MLLDKLGNDILAKDGLCLCYDLELIYNNLQQLSIVPDDFEKVGKWLKTLKQMEDGDEIDIGQARQMALDIESSYAAFNSVLKNKKDKDNYYIRLCFALRD